jgi:hypothetical protein
LWLSALEESPVCGARLKGPLVVVGVVMMDVKSNNGGFVEARLALPINLLD